MAGLAVGAGLAMASRAAGAQEFSAVMVDTHGADTVRTPFAVGSGKVRWSTMRGDTTTGAIILDSRRHTLVGFDDPTQSYFQPTSDDPSSEQAEVFAIMRPTDVSDPCHGWNAAAATDRGQPAHFACRSLGTETIAGQSTEKWELTHVRTGKKGYAWIDPHLHYLIRLQDPDAGSTTEVRDIKEGPQAQALFAVPSGYHKSELPYTPPPTLPSRVGGP